MTLGAMIYIGLIGVVGSLSLWWLRRRLRKTELQRKERLKQVREFEAVGTDSPLNDPHKDAQRKGLHSIGTRFTIMRRVLVPCVSVAILVALSFPFLGRLPSTVISLLVAATTVVIGIAAKPYVENLISGIVITFSRLIRIGDTVLVDDHYGTVEDISTTHTTVKIWDWRRYAIPNASMLNKEFINYCVNDTFRWVPIEFWVDYSADLELVKRIAVHAAAKSSDFADYEPPRFWIMDMTKEGIRCMVAAWADSPPEAWALSGEARTELIREFQTHGITTHSYHHQGSLTENMSSGAEISLAASESRMRDRSNTDTAPGEHNVN